MMTVSFLLSPLPQPPFHTQTKADRTKTLYWMNSQVLLNLHRRVSVRSLDIITIPVHFFLNIWNISFNWRILSITDKALRMGCKRPHTTSKIIKRLELHRTLQGKLQEEGLLFNVQTANAVTNSLVPAMDYLRRAEKLVRITHRNEMLHWVTCSALYKSSVCVCMCVHVYNAGNWTQGHMHVP